MAGNLAFVVGRSLLPETLEVDLEEVVLSKFRCHTKKAPKILTSSRTPSQIHQNVLHPSDFLTPTEMSSGSGKQRKPIGVEKPFTAGGGSWKHRKPWPYPFWWCANETFLWIRIFKRAKARVDTRIREKAWKRAGRDAETSHVWEKPFWLNKINGGRSPNSGLMPKTFDLTLSKKILGYTPARYNPMAVFEWKGETVYFCNKSPQKF